MNPPSIYTILSDRAICFVFWIISKESERSSPFPEEKGIRGHLESSFDLKELRDAAVDHFGARTEALDDNPLSGLEPFKLFIDTAKDIHPYLDDISHRLKGPF